ncbi:MAG: hypothetical protein ACTHMG_16040 [Sphingomonas sp.]
MTTNQNGEEPGMIAGLRVRHDGWTAARQRAFLRALSETGCVRDACARVQISNTSAYRMRKRSEAFARAWDRAIAKAMPTLEQAAYERAVLGWEEPVLHGGKVVANKRRYSDALLRLLIQRGAAAAEDLAGAQMPAGARVPAAATPYRRATQEETDAALMKKLDALERRLLQDPEEQAARAAAERAREEYRRQAAAGRQG